MQEACSRFRGTLSRRLSSAAGGRSIPPVTAADERRRRHAALRPLRPPSNEKPRCPAAGHRAAADRDHVLPVSMTSQGSKQSKAVLVTGASGYAAQFIVLGFLQDGWKVRTVLRDACCHYPAACHSCRRHSAAATAAAAVAATRPPPCPVPCRVQVGCTYLAGQEPKFEGATSFKVRDAARGACCRAPVEPVHLQALPSSSL